MSSGDREGSSRRDVIAAAILKRRIDGPLPGTGIDALADAVEAALQKWNKNAADIVNALADAMPKGAQTADDMNRWIEAMFQIGERAQVWVHGGQEK